MPLLRLPPAPAPPSAVDELANLINNHPFPASPLRPLLAHHLRPPLLTPPLLDSLLSRFFTGHAPGLKALEVLRFSLNIPHFTPSPNSLNTTIHILTRMRDFDSAFTLIDETLISHPHLLTSRSVAILLSRLARFKGFQETLSAFMRLELAWQKAGVPFGVEEFNGLLRAFCAISQVVHARALFHRLHSRFPPNPRTLNTLLVGFRESGNVVALDVFYHESILRGFKPDVVTYNIRMDAYCKNRRFGDAVDLLDEMGRRNCVPSVQTLTTLIHGAGNVGKTVLAQQMFDEIGKRGLIADRGAHNALLGALLKGRDMKRSMKLMDEMEGKEFGINDVTYYTMFCAMKRFGELEGFCKMYRRMVERNFVPRPRTVMMLMKLFCENGWTDMGLELWDFLVDKGCFPHPHVFDLLVKTLCCRGKVSEAYRCVMQMVQRGRMPAERGYRVLEEFLKKNSEAGKLEELNQMMNKLNTGSTLPK